MVSEAALTNIVTAVVVIALLSTAIMPKRMNYGFNGILLLLLGGIPLLHDLGVLPFTFGEAGIIKYVVTVVVIFAAKSLIAEGIKEEHTLRWVTITAGIVIAVLALVPTLYELGALTFTIPEYPGMVNQIIYLVAAILLFAGIFLAKKE